MNIIGIKCGEKLFISEHDGDRQRSIKNLMIDGEKPTNSFHSNWCIVDKEPTKIQKIIKQSRINHRYELIDSSMMSKKCPLVLRRDDVVYKEDYEWYWKDEYSMYKSLYELISDEQPDILEEIDFKYETIMIVDEINKPEKFKYSGIIKHQVIDKILFPDIILPSKPCSLNVLESYNIVRKYVKQHINYDVASITSDYDFCFTVKKRIMLSEVEKYTVDVNNSWFNKRTRTPKHETRYKKVREVECFNMAPKPYQSYSVIKAFRGDNQDDLQNNIDSYCENLIEFINKPLEDCPHCKGFGVVLSEHKS